MFHGALRANRLRQAQVSVQCWQGMYQFAAETTICFCACAERRFYRTRLTNFFHTKPIFRLNLAVNMLEAASPTAKRFQSA
jgi:hypothetical protein